MPCALHIVTAFYGDMLSLTSKVNSVYTTDIVQELLYYTAKSVIYTNTLQSGVKWIT